MRLVRTAEGYEYWIPDANEAEGNPLYSPPPEQTNVQPQLALPVELPSGDDVSDLPTFKIQTLGKPKDTRSKEEKLAEMFGVVPGPEGPLDLVKSFVSGLTAPGEVAKGEVETGDLLSRAIDTAGLGVTGAFGKPLTMKNVMKSDTSDVGKSVSVAQQAKPFFTNVEASLAKIPMKSGTAEQWINAFKRYGAGKEELQYTIGELPKGQISRQQIEQHLKDNAVQLNDVWKGQIEKPWENLSKNEIDNLRKDYEEIFGEKPTDRELEEWHSDNYNKSENTKYSQYQMPGGGTNYRELLLTTPHTPRDMVRPSDAASAKYLPEWNKLVEERRRLQPLVDDYDRKLTGEAWEQANKDFRAINKKMDELHDKMVDDTIAASNGRLGGEAYRGSHWDEPNVIAHVRMNDRIINEPGFTVVNRKSGFKGKSFRTKEEAEAGLKEYPESIRGDLIIRESQLPTKTLHLEEIQSDWHQTGRKQGYLQQADKTKFDEANAALEQARKNLENIAHELRVKNNLISARDSLAQVNDIQLRNRMREERTKVYNESPEYKAAEAEIKRLENEVSKYNYVNKVPNAPFKNNWDELALKKAIRQAVEEGYDAISWTPGKHQSTNPSNQIKELKVSRNKVNKEVDPNIIQMEFEITAIDKNGKAIEQSARDLKELENLVGKDIASKIDKQQFGEHKTYSGLDLEIGGTKEFYDKILVDKANKLVKQFGGKVEEKRIRNPKEADAYEELNRNQKTPVGDYDKAFPKVWTIKLTPELKKHALEKGFSLFSTTPVLIPIDHNPFKRQDVKLVPVVGNPFGEK